VLAALLALFLMFTLGPFLWLGWSSLQPLSELITVPYRFGWHPLSLDNYVRLFNSGSSGLGGTFVLAIRNSVIVATATAALSLAVGSSAAYAFARLRFHGRNTLLLVVLGVNVLPSITIVVPLFIIMRELHLLDTWWALILTYTTFSVPLTMWILSGYFRTIPASLENAARCDGCSRWGAFWRVVLPLAAPGYAATAVFAFLGAWDEFFLALVFTSTYDSKTLPVALAEFITRFGLDWGRMTAGGFIATLPPVILALLVQRYLATGLLAGAVKG
jgi:multiple sugar transport system permease protein